MKLNHKVKAFTLAELIVVLAITSFVLIVAMYAQAWLGKSIKSLQSKFIFQNEIIILENILMKNFNTSSVYYDDRDKLLEFYKGTDVFEIKFEDTYAVNNKKDTLWIGESEIILYLQKKQVKKGFVDAVNIKFENKKEFFISKVNDASFYMN